MSSNTEINNDTEIKLQNKILKIGLLALSGVILILLILYDYYNHNTKNNQIIIIHVVFIILFILQFVFHLLIYLKDKDDDNNLLYLIISVSLLVFIIFIFGFYIFAVNDVELDKSKPTKNYCDEEPIERLINASDILKNQLESKIVTELNKTDRGNLSEMDFHNQNIEKATSIIIDKLKNKSTNYIISNEEALDMFKSYYKQYKENPIPMNTKYFENAGLRYLFSKAVYGEPTNIFRQIKNQASSATNA